LQNYTDCINIVSLEEAMTRRQKEIGRCCICGVEGKLSFEHVPPRSAFNKHPILEFDVKKLIGNWEAEIKGKIQQLGAGSYTLCEKCNTTTGAWYGPAYAEWAHQAFRLLSLTRGAPTLCYQFRIFPLRVLKQIICIFFSANGPGFGEVHPDLVKFVLNREDRDLKPEIHTTAHPRFRVNLAWLACSK